jgi:hypothetical protein
VIGPLYVFLHAQHPKRPCHTVAHSTPSVSAVRPGKAIGGITWGGRVQNKGGKMTEASETEGGW